MVELFMMPRPPSSTTSGHFSLEYALGLNPSRLDGRGTVAVTTTETGGVPYLTLVVTRAGRAPDVQYVAEVTASLQQGKWASGDAATVVVEDTETRWVVHDRQPISKTNPVRAMRLRVVKQ